MAWTFWKPDTPTNLSGSLVAGGTLDANTTYYFKVFAWDTGNTTTARTNVTQAYRQVFSAYSATFSITTDTTNKSVALTWDAVLKRNGITQVDAYEVLISTSDNFDAGADDSTTFIPSQFGYYSAATFTNSVTVTTKAGYYKLKNTKDGLPLFEWDGVGSGTTFKSLYDTLEADATYNVYAKKLTTWNDTANVFGYMFWGNIVVTRYSGDTASGVYSFTSLGDIVFIFGSFSCGGQKYYIDGSYIACDVTSHAGGMSFFTYPVAGSIKKASTFRYGIGTVPTGKSWGPGGQNYSPQNYVSTTESSANNNHMAWHQSADSQLVATTSFITQAWVRGSNAGSLAPANSAHNDNGIQNYWSTYFNQVATGKVKNLICEGSYNWMGYSGKLFGYDMTNNTREYFQVGLSSYVDCIWRWRSYTGITDSDGWNPVINNSYYYGPQINNSTFYIGKTIYLTVKDTDGNPISGATVKFESVDGINLGRANSIDKVCRAGGPTRSNGNNYEYAETAIKHNQSKIWVRENCGGDDTGGTAPTIGKTYWYGTEKLIFNTRVGVSSWDANAYEYLTTRGVDNTPTSWILSGNASYDHRFMEAVDSHTTDANGITFNMCPFVVYKLNPLTTDYNKQISSWVSGGQATKYTWGPIKVTVSATGKKNVIYTISETYATTLGTNIINLEVVMDSQVSMIVVDGYKTVLNLAPAKAVNGDGWMEM